MSIERKENGEIRGVVTMGDVISEDKKERDGTPTYLKRLRKHKDEHKNKKQSQRDIRGRK